MKEIESQQVAFWPVHEFVQRYLDTAGHYPAAGTPAWCELPTGDRRKWAALLDYAQHHALRVEISQEQYCEAAQKISAVCDWAAVAQRIRHRTEFESQHPWLERGAA
ncbi:DUF2742 domain-containing protein [Mycobacterium sp. URHB0021]